MNECSARALLGVSRSATPGQIKRAYRQRALELHPDRGGDPEAFQRLVEAQDRLLSSVRRVGRGSAWFDGNVAPTRTDAPAPFVRRPARSLSTTQATTRRSFGDVLAEKLADAA